MEEAVEDLILELPDEERILVQSLRNLIWDEIPGIREKLSWGAPFFYRHGTICFTWPTSIPNSGAGYSSPSVLLGFAKGYLMSNADGYLEKGDRKQVYMRLFTDIQQIDYDRVRLLLHEAAWIDEQTAKSRARKKR